MKIALFGGTFDPPHIGHRFIAEAAVRECGLQRVIFLPCHQSPHKTSTPHATDTQRTEMVRLLIKDLPWAEVSTWELHRDGPSFSWQTVVHFQSERPGDELHWILGADQWLVIDKWGRPDFLAEHLRFIVFPRNGITPSPNPKFRALFLTDSIDVSATEIRQRLAAGKSPGKLVPAPVARFIKENRLYRNSGTDPQ